MNEPKPHKTIGGLLLDVGKLNLQDMDSIERYQKEQGLQFGEAAVKLGLVAESDVSQMLAQQFDYSYLQPGEGGLSEELAAAYKPFSNHVETIRDLRSQLGLRWFNRGCKQLSLVSVGSAKNCSILAANLAIVFSQLGQRTVLVDANLRNPLQHSLFNLQQSTGLSEMLAGHVGVETILEIPKFAGLSVLTSGATPPNPQELLGRSVFKSLMHDLEENYDVILLDTPNAMLCSDTQIIVEETGAALLVMDKGRTRISDAIALQAQLTNAKAEILGVVLNEF